MSEKIVLEIGKQVNNVWFPDGWVSYNLAYPEPVSSSGVSSGVSSSGSGSAISPVLGGTFGENLEIIYNTYKLEIDSASSKYNVPIKIIVGLIYKESAGKSRAVSTGSAAGLVQFVPATAISYGLKIQYLNIGPVTPGLNLELSQLTSSTAGNYGSIMSKYGAWIDSKSPCNIKSLQYCDYDNDDRFKPSLAIPAGAHYLSKLYKSEGSWNDALVRYNGGPNKYQYAKDILSYAETFDAYITSKS